MDQNSIRTLEVLRRKQFQQNKDCICRNFNQYQFLNKKPSTSNSTHKYDNVSLETTLPMGFLLTEFLIRVIVGQKVLPPNEYNKRDLLISRVLLISGYLLFPLYVIKNRRNSLENKNYQNLLRAFVYGNLLFFFALNYTFFKFYPIFKQRYQGRSNEKIKEDIRAKH